VSQDRRRFTREFKLAALARFEGAGDVRELARELGIRRELLYRWRAKYEAGGAPALTTTGRPRGLPMPAAESQDYSDEDRARRRIAELERKVGQQQVELDFFREALRQVKDLPQPSGKHGGPASIRRSK
jgi:transposase